jgi:hypothetical protein
VGQLKVRQDQWRKPRVEATAWWFGPSCDVAVDLAEWPSKRRLAFASSRSQPAQEAEADTVGETDLTNMHLRTWAIFGTWSILAASSASVVARSLEMDWSEFLVEGRRGWRGHRDGLAKPPSSNKAQECVEEGGKDRGCACGATFSGAELRVDIESRRSDAGHDALGAFQRVRR